MIRIMSQIKTAYTDGICSNSGILSKNPVNGLGVPVALA